jgi:hypothetical protein
MRSHGPDTVRCPPGQGLGTPNARHRAGSRVNRPSLQRTFGLSTALSCPRPILVTRLRRAALARLARARQGWPLPTLSAVASHRTPNIHLHFLAEIPPAVNRVSTSRRRWPENHGLLSLLLNGYPNRPKLQTDFLGMGARPADAGSGSNQPHRGAVMPVAAPAGNRPSRRTANTTRPDRSRTHAATSSPGLTMSAPRSHMSCCSPTCVPAR